MKCSKARELLSAHVDGELDAVVRTAVEDHLTGCDPCRAAARVIADVAEEVRRHFSDTLGEVRPIPAEVVERFRDPQRDSSKKVRQMMFRTVTGIGVAAAAIVLLLLFPTSSIGETPAEVAGRAAAHYQSLRAIELLVTPSSEAVDLLSTIFDGNSSDSEQKIDESAQPQKGAAKRDILSPFSVLLGAPNRALIDFSPEKDSGDGTGVMGFNGRDFWAYDAETDTIHLQTPQGLHLDTAKLGEEFFDLQNADFLEFVSWGFVHELNEASKDGKGHRLTEVTGPYETRVGHRAFEFDLRRDNSEDQLGEVKKRFLQIKVRVVIDPRTDLIEKTVFDISLGGLSLVRLRAELVSVNPSIDEAIFDYQRLKTPRTKVVHEGDAGRAGEAEKKKGKRRK